MPVVRLDAFFHLLVLLGIAPAVVDGLADVALQLLQGLVSVLLLNQHIVARAVDVRAARKRVENRNAERGLDIFPPVIAELIFERRRLIGMIHVRDEIVGLVSARYG